MIKNDKNFSRKYLYHKFKEVCVSYNPGRLTMFPGLKTLDSDNKSFNTKIIILQLSARMSITEKTTAGKWLDNAGLALNKQQEMDFTYSNVDKLIRLSLGENAHVDNALYFNNDYSISLEQAQQQKCDYVAKYLGISKGTRVLDMGCGWGGFLKYLKDIGADATGVSLSKGQVAACRRNGLKASLKDMREITPEDFGTFDAVTAIGSLDHVASINDYLNAKQDEVYDRFFKTVAALLPSGGRFYVQCMVFSKNMLPFEEFDINAPKDSPAYILALQAKHHPNSWLPYGGDHIIRVASPYFKMIDHNSGRLDYIETNRQWHNRFIKFGLSKYLWYLSLVPKFITDKEFRYQLDVLRHNPNRLCFENEIFDHSRLVFEKL
jgi:cyclopropane-fatty-acyl-phospholipid synthase